MDRRPKTEPVPTSARPLRDGLTHPAGRQGPIAWARHCTAE
jgi:hypothetical protein